MLEDFASGDRCKTMEIVSKGSKVNCRDGLHKEALDLHVKTMGFHELLMFILVLVLSFGAIIGVHACAVGDSWARRKLY